MKKLVKKEKKLLLDYLQNCTNLSTVTLWVKWARVLMNEKPVISDKIYILSYYTLQYRCMLETLRCMDRKEGRRQRSGINTIKYHS